MKVKKILFKKLIVLTALLIFIFNFIESKPIIINAEVVEINDNLLNVKNEQPEELNFPIIIRDFKADYTFFEHSQANMNWLGAGMVSSELGTDKNPIFNKETIDTLSEDLNLNIEKIKKNAKASKSQYKAEILERLNQVKSKGSYDDTKAWYEGIKTSNYQDIKSQINTAYRFVYYHMNSFFNDVNTINTQDDSVIKHITLSKVGKTDKYSFASKKTKPYSEIGGFFPFDGQGFGNDGFEGNGIEHNFHFSIESHSKFWLAKNEKLEFNFSGDDDMWMYIDNKLTIDLGGVHTEQSQKVVIEPKPENPNKSLVKVDGKVKFELDSDRWYDFDFFYMERHTAQSNLKIETNIKFVPVMEVDKNAYLVDNANNEIELEDGEVVYPGETVYYKFKLHNTGNVDLTNITFVDEVLDVKIDSTGVYKLSTGNPIEYNDITVIKNGEIVTGDEPLKALEHLNKKEDKKTTIEIKSRDFLKRVILESDVKEGQQSSEIKNTVIGKANYFTFEEGEINYSADASTTVNPKQTNEENTVLEADIIKAIDEINRDGISIYKDGDEILPNILPEDKVTFKFQIENKSYIERLTNGETVSKTSIGLEGIKLSDILSIGNNPNVKNQWTFLKEDKITEFDINQDLNNDGIGDGVYLNPEEQITFYTIWDVTYDEANYYEHTLEKDVLNNINMKKSIIKDGTEKIVIDKNSSVQLKVQPINLKLEKNLKNLEGVLDNSIEPGKTFTLIVSGSDGSKYIIEAEAGKEYLLKNLRYGEKAEDNSIKGVKYEVSEIVPMNYKLESIKVSDILTSEVLLSKDNHNEKAIITNKKENESYFSDDTKVINKFNNYSPKN